MTAQNFSRLVFSAVLALWIVSFGAAAKLYAVGHCCDSDDNCGTEYCCACCSESSMSVHCPNGTCLAKCTPGPECTGDGSAKCSE